MQANDQTKGEMTIKQSSSPISGTAAVGVKIRPRVYKTYFVLTSAEHEILNAHEYKNIKQFNIFQAKVSLECYFSCPTFFLLINVKLQTIVGILIFMSRKKILEHELFFISDSGPVLV